MQTQIYNSRPEKLLFGNIKLFPRWWLRDKIFPATSEISEAFQRYEMLKTFQMAWVNVQLGPKVLFSRTRKLSCLVN